MLRNRLTDKAIVVPNMKPCTVHTFVIPLYSETYLKGLVATSNHI